MGATDYDLLSELEAIKTSVKSTKLENVELMVCVPAMIRFRISKTTAKTMDVCCQLPQDYPNDLVILDLRSKFLPTKFLDSAVKMIEERKQDFIGKPHVFVVFCAIYEFLDANPLCVCAQEIGNVKKLLAEDDAEADSSQNYLKVRQKQSTLVLRVQKAAYYLEVRLLIGNDYPASRTIVELESTNFPKLFTRYFGGQAAEIARQAIEPPILKFKKGQKKKPKQPEKFEPGPSVEAICRFLIENVRRYPVETCGLCDKRALADDPKDTPLKDDLPAAVHRVYCGHVFHFECIDPFMKTPPFTGGKKCPKCESIIYHDKWRASEKTREERWAHQQAKQRELEEVQDFMS